MIGHTVIPMMEQIGVLQLHSHRHSQLPRLDFMPGMPVQIPPLLQMQIIS